MKRKVFELSSTIEDGEDVNPSFTFEGQSDKFDGIGPVNVVRVRCPKQFGVLAGSEGQIDTMQVAPWKQPSEAIQNYNDVLFDSWWERYPWYESGLGTSTDTGALQFNNNTKNGAQALRAFSIENHTDNPISARIRLYFNKDLTDFSGNNIPGTSQYVFLDKTVSLLSHEEIIIGPHNLDRGDIVRTHSDVVTRIYLPVNFRYSKYTMCSVVDATTGEAFSDGSSVEYHIKLLAEKDNSGNVSNHVTNYSSVPTLALTTGNVIKYEFDNPFNTRPMPSPLFDDLAMQRLGFLAANEEVLYPEPTTVTATTALQEVVTNIGVRQPIFNDVQRLIMDLNPSTQKIVSRHSQHVDTQVLYDHASITFTTDDDPTDNSLYAIYSQSSDFNTNALFNETGMTDSYAYRLQRFLFDLKTGTTVTQPLVLPLPFNFVEVKAVMDETGAEPQTKQEVLPSQQPLIPSQMQRQPRILPGVPTPQDMRG